MAGLTGLQPLSRVQGSFPLQVAYGETGAGSLESQGSALAPQDLSSPAVNRSTIPGYSAEAPPPPYPFDEAFGDFVLPGQLNPDRTPRTHAAPYGGWAGDYNNGDEMSQLQANLNEIHAEDFGALRERTNLAGVDQPTFEVWQSNDAGGNNLQPITGQMRNMGGYDTSQGYDLRNRYGFDAGHRQRITATDPQPTYVLEASERPFIVPQGGRNAVFTDSVQGPQTAEYNWGYGDAASPYRPPTDYAPVAEPENFEGQYVEGPIV